jgi:hypothetical protein
MPSLWWALIALVSPMLVNLGLAATGGAPDTWQQVVAFFSAFLGSIVSGAVCVAVMLRRIQATPTKRTMTGVVVFGVSTLAACVLAFYGCSWGGMYGMYSPTHAASPAPGPRSR